MALGERRENAASPSPTRRLAPAPLEMSDDDYDDDGPGGPREDDVQLDEHGYPVSLAGSVGGKFQAQLNPLQQKMEQQKREREDKAKREAKKAALASRAAAFGSIKEDTKGKAEVEKDAKKPAETTKVPDVVKPKLESKVVDMMKSGFHACPIW